MDAIKIDMAEVERIVAESEECIALCHGPAIEEPTWEEISGDDDGVSIVDWFAYIARNHSGEWKRRQDGRRFSTREEAVADSSRLEKLKMEGEIIKIGREAYWL